MAEDPAEEGAAMAPGELFVLSAPSGTGKSTLIRRLFDHHPEVADGIRFSVSHTTRPSRPEERDGREYHFVDRGEFEAMIAAGRFLEWARVFGRHLYGTSREAVEEQLAAGWDVLLDIEVQGARQVLERWPEAVSIFVLPPSFEALEERLRGRAADGEGEIARRLRTARDEVRQCHRYEYVILNDDVDRACRALAAVFLARRHRRERMGGRIDRILDGFPPPPAEPDG
jgi:guanylate kinase